MDDYKYYWNEGRQELRILEPGGRIQNDWLMLMDYTQRDWSIWLEGAKEVPRLVWMIRRYFRFKSEAEMYRTQAQSALSELEHFMKGIVE